MEKTIILVNAYLLEEPLTKKIIVRVNAFLLSLRIEDEQLTCTNKGKNLSPNHLLEENEK